MKMFLVLALLVGVVACESKDKPSDPVIPGPTATPVPPCAEGAVRNADGHCVIPQPVADYCNPEGKQVECEAQFSMNATKCRKFDGSDWAPSYFKDIPALDAYGKANRFAFYINFRTPDQMVVGTTESVFPWHCKRK